MNNSTGTTNQEYLRYFQIGWCALTLLICLPGNTLILVASIKYKAIKLDKVAITLIEHIAVADIGVVLFVVLPRMVSGILDGWEYACDISAQFLPLFSGVGILLITLLNISKLTCLLFPLRARLRTHTQGRIIAASAWICIILALVLIEVAPLILLGEFLNGDYFLNYYTCNVVPQPEVDVIYSAVVAVFIFVPILITIGTTVRLMVYVQKVRGLSKESVVTLIAISLVLFVSFIPLGMTRVFSDRLNVLFGDDLFIHYHMFVYAVQYVNSMANPFIYFFTVKSFNKFVVDMFRSSKRVAPL